ncbi:acyltransferase [Patulibacter minatonensis]|uniref:acyltransferase n=1 Tax=Patulibacter minatonensis TaxID=298163 RepID=UPI0004AC9A88|nr:acyltransferase [Patulibacter minatonensis]
MLTLNKLKALRRVLVDAKRFYLTRIFGIDLHPTCQFSLSAYFDRTFPKGVHVGKESYVAVQSMILTHDRVRGLYVHTRVGKRCFIGARSILMPGVQIGDGCVVAAGAVVTRDVPPGCIVAGNPAKVIREGIDVLAYGRYRNADETTLRLKAEGLLD